MKTLTGPEGRIALYALAAATGDAVLALEVPRDEAFAAADAGARRVGSAKPPVVVLLKDAAVFASAATQLRWKSVPAQVLVDATRADPAVAARVVEVLSAVAPVVVAVAAEARFAEERR